MNIFIVIAAYNEGKSISKVVKNLKNAGYNNIVVVDDGSRDETSKIALDSGAIVLKHVVNRGQGAALKTGMDYALRNGADIIVHFDADGQHRIEDLKPMIEPVASGKFDITVGSRFLKNSKNSNIPWFRRLSLKMAVFIVWLFYGVKMTDAHNGFRAMNRKAANAIDITSDRMEHASQIVEEMYKKHLKYKEVPVTILYTDYSIQHGHGGFVQGLKILSRMIYRKLMN
jgi:glycosyltransferase involved in cell wall biosynthesis